MASTQPHPESFAFPSQRMTRRQALKAAACGFGYLALAGLASRRGRRSNPLAPKTPHFPPKARRVIFLFMQGGPSHVDSFDYKPRLKRDDGKMLAFDDARTHRQHAASAASSQRVMKSLWKFAQHGQCGRWVSDAVPGDRRSTSTTCASSTRMHTEGVAHGPATLFLHCGSTNFIRPSMGVVGHVRPGHREREPARLRHHLPVGGQRRAAQLRQRLPARRSTRARPSAGPAARRPRRRSATSTNAQLSPTEQKRQFDLLQALNAEQLKADPGDAELEAVINSYELAWRMQNNAPDVLDLSKESAATLALYGIGEKATDNFGRQCLMARRLCEAGVRYVQVTYGDNTANPAWDQHSNLPKHADHARAVDKPIAGLLADLKQRGLLEDTLVWWGGEFGRTPYAEKNGTGRDHNPGGFTVWLAGGGVKPGFAYGATDEFGHTPSRTRSTCTTCTPRSCTCSASTTRG